MTSLGRGSSQFRVGRDDSKPFGCSVGKLTQSSWEVLWNRAPEGASSSEHSLICSRAPFLPFSTSPEISVERQHEEHDGFGYSISYSGYSPHEEAFVAVEGPGQLKGHMRAGSQDCLELNIDGFYSHIFCGVDAWDFQYIPKGLHYIHWQAGYLAQGSAGWDLQYIPARGLMGWLHGVYATESIFGLTVWFQELALLVSCCCCCCCIIRRSGSAKSPTARQPAIELNAAAAAPAHSAPPRMM